MAFKLKFSHFSEPSPVEIGGRSPANSNFSIGPVIRDRTEKVTALFDHLRDHPTSNISAHSRFILSLEYKCKIYTCGGILGGELYDLSEKQVAYLDSLHEQLVVFGNRAAGQIPCQYPHQKRW